MVNFWATHLGMDALQKDIQSRESYSSKGIPMEQKEWLRRNAVNRDAEYAGNPIPVGTLVEYQGSIGYVRGETFAVIDLPADYPGGRHAHPGSLTLAWPNDPNRVILWNVRPKSVRVIDPK